MNTDISPVVAFDLDGTLAETAPDLIHVLNLTLADEHLPDTRVEEARQLVGNGVKILVQRALAKYGKSVSEERLEELFQRFLGLYEQNICIYSRLYPGVEAALQELLARGYRLAVCTNKPDRHSHLLLEALGIAGCFAAICGRDALPWAKPDARALWGAIEKAGGVRERAVMVGDSKTDFETAHNAGVPSIAFPFGYATEPVENYAPTLVVASWAELVPAVERLLGP
ncbi:MAG: phosphoglycolate phosphatase [Methylobacteriaceae bacterium]|jgi:phosphoglycolate phosphatase|nr:phosphoglycolate phosphatase [Methylobacteriaceae bacterium]